jgi:hypothetical protein
LRVRPSLAEVVKDRAWALKLFESRTIKTPTCWFWNGTVVDGYGRLALKGSPVRAHRLAWALFKGSVPDPLIVCHKCDVCHCVNPEHLFLGTNADNTQDMLSKGRHKAVAGESHYNSKLSDQDISDIRWVVSLGVTQKDVSDFWGTTKGNVSEIINGRSRTRLERS